MEKTKDSALNHAVRYDHFGHRDVLYIDELPLPSPKTGEVLVKIKTAGINPGEAAIREGLMTKQFPSHFSFGTGGRLCRNRGICWKRRNQVRRG